MVLVWIQSILDGACIGGGKEIMSVWHYEVLWY